MHSSAAFALCFNGQLKDRQLISENAYFVAPRQIQNVTFKEIKITVAQRPNPFRHLLFYLFPTIDIFKVRRFTQET